MVAFRSAIGSCATVLKKALMYRVGEGSNRCTSNNAQYHGIPTRKFARIGLILLVCAYSFRGALLKILSSLPAADVEASIENRPATRSVTMQKESDPPHPKSY
jgi:hypothetical protein